MFLDIEEGSEVVMEEVVQLLPSLLQLSGSLVVDGQLITSITWINCQHMSSRLQQRGRQLNICNQYSLCFQRSK